MDINELARKLKQARRATGMSTRMVEIKLPASCRVSHATIANFEAGRSVPDMRVLAGLADLYQRPLTWFVSNGRVLSGVRYRNLKTKVRISDRHAFEAVSQKWLEAYANFETWIREPARKLPAQLNLEPEIEPAQAARQVRQYFGLRDDDAVPSVVSWLDELGVRVIEIFSAMRIDALAAKLGEEDVVVLNPVLSAARTRLNAGHELGHVILKDTAEFPTEDHELAEKRAFEFASHLLLTPKMLKEAFRGFSMVRLLEFKRRYGISMAAMIYRAEREAGLLSKSVARNLWIEFSKRGWRQSEPGEVKDDRATRFEQLVDGGIIQQHFNWADAARIAGVRENELRERVDQAKQGIPSLPNMPNEDRPFMRLVE